MGDLNLDYRKRNDASYHLQRLYDEWNTFEQESQLVQTVDFTTWQRTNGNQIVSSILDHLYTTNWGVFESLEEGEYVFGDHCPVIVTLMCQNGCTSATRQMRDWEKYSPDLLLSELKKQSWNINVDDVKDYNDELEQWIMTIVDKLAPFVTKGIAGNNFLLNLILLSLPLT